MNRYCDASGAASNRRAAQSCGESDSAHGHRRASLEHLRAQNAVDVALYEWAARRASTACSTGAGRRPGDSLARTSATGDPELSRRGPRAGSAFPPHFRRADHHPHSRMAAIASACLTRASPCGTRPAPRARHELASARVVLAIADAVPSSCRSRWTCRCPRRVQRHASRFLRGSHTSGAAITVRRRHVVRVRSGRTTFPPQEVHHGCSTRR